MRHTKKQSNVKGGRLNIVLAIAYLIWIFASGSGRGTQTLAVDDKLLHMVAFALMYFLWFRAFAVMHPSWAYRRCKLASGVTSAAAGALLELWQLLLPYRNAELGDFIADLAGVLIAALCLQWYLKRQGNEEQCPM